MTTQGLDLEAVAAALAVQVSHVAGIRQTFDHYPDRVPQIPAALVGFAEVVYNRRFEVGAAEATLPVTVVVGRANEAESQRLIRRFQSRKSDETPVQGEFLSVGAALADDRTLNGTCATSTMSTSGTVSAVSIANVDYLAVEFAVTVHA